MIRKTVAALVLVPLAVLIILFAVANRASVVVSLDPFSAEATAFAVAAPLFLVVLCALIFGVIVGGLAAWLRQAKWRHAARRLERELARARAEAAERERSLVAAHAPPPSASIASIAYRRPPAA